MLQLPIGVDNGPKAGWGHHWEACHRGLSLGPRALLSPPPNWALRASYLKGRGYVDKVLGGLGLRPSPLDFSRGLVDTAIFQDTGERKQ